VIELMVHVNSARAFFLLQTQNATLPTFNEALAHCGQGLRQEAARQLSIAGPFD
jgi:hypothetical protein